eukprot:TCONS_00060515-protein
MYLKVISLLFILASPTQVISFNFFEELTKALEQPGRFYARYLNTSDAYCEFKGYAPGGNKVIVQKIIAPVAKMEQDVLSGLTANLGTLVDAVDNGGMILQGIETIQKVSKFASKLSGALGAFGIGLAVLDAFTSPSPQDILDQANKAIEKLTDEVNERLDEMKGYVDQKTIHLEKDLISREYKSLFKMWGNCLKEVSEIEVNECQEDAVKDIMAARPKFALFSNQVQANKELPVYDTKRIETSLITFRDYVILCLGSISALTATYAELPAMKKKFHRYAEDLNNEIRWSTRYAQNAVSMIKKMHYGRDYCNKTLNCKTNEQWEGWWTSSTHVENKLACTCVFDGADIASHKCGKDVFVRMDRHYNLDKWGYQWYETNQNWEIKKNWEDGGKWIALKRLHGDHDYVAKLKESVDNYWQGSLLDLLPSWKALHVIKLSKRDEMEYQDERYGAQKDWKRMRSKNYERRRRQVKDEMAIEMDSQYAEGGEKNVDEFYTNE